MRPDQTPEARVIRVLAAPILMALLPDDHPLRAALSVQLTADLAAEPELAEPANDAGRSLQPRITRPPR